MKRGPWAAVYAVLAAICLLLPGTAHATTEQPNIVIFYLDDVAPIDGRLWSNPKLTPTITEYFVNHGVRFTSAIGETPLCCPGRAGLLTGLHTHNHGVLYNNAALFDAREHIGSELKDAGYATMMVGKYLNRNNRLTKPEWKVHQSGWTFLDVILGPNGKFFDFTLKTTTGRLTYEHEHSTKVTAERTVARMRSVPASQPIFSVVSLYNLHDPNIPMPGFEGGTRWLKCAKTPPWLPPNYDEADVTDKPAFVQAQQRTGPAAGWPMVGYCREMLGVDWAVKKVIDELERQHRLDNTLLVFTADNGMPWGAHRLGDKKLTPYGTAVPLYMWWPARFGDVPRDINEPVSNIDLAPTLCAIGGCEMGPYPAGQQHADGVSLLPLLEGTVSSLGRAGILESAFNGERNWRAIRTGPADPLGAWHYVEWLNGERELYDLTNDPWELQSLHSSLDHAAIRDALALRLAALNLEGVVSPIP